MGEYIDTTTGKLTRPSGSGGGAHVVDIAVHPGEDSTLSRVTTIIKAPRVVASTSAGQTLKSGEGVLVGLLVTAVGTAPTLNLYDSTTAAGTQVIPQLTGTAQNNLPAIAAGTFWACPVPIHFTNGLHAVIGGTGTTTMHFYVI